MFGKFNSVGFGTVVVLAAAALAMFSLSGVSFASSPSAPAVRPSLIAVAIGQLEETNGDYATVDLHAAVKAGVTRGALRFFSEDEGYYNGAVKSLTCQDGVITARGSGGFFPKGGKRIAVVFEAHFDNATGATTITIKGRNGFQYTLTGTLEGIIRCGDPAQASATTQ